MSLLDVTTEIQAALASLRKGQAFINEEIARLEAFLASGTTSQAEPKRRGRPPKAASQVAAAAPAPTTAKRGPGRPRKSAAVAPAPVAQAPAKRGPGRPRKNPEAAASSPAKAGRRPWSPAQREAARKRMKDYWAGQKKKG